MIAVQPAAVLVPRVSVNDDNVTISRFALEAGANVRPGDILFSMGTSKADVDVEAEAEGHFWPVVEVGASVDVGAVVGYLTATAERPANLARPAVASAEPRATLKAAALAAKLAIDLAELDQRGIIRERDVEAFADRRARAAAAGKPVVGVSGPAAAVAGPAEPLATSLSAAAGQSGPLPGGGGVAGLQDAGPQRPSQGAYPAVPVQDGASTSVRPAATGRVDAEFLAGIRKPGSGFAQLASDLKIHLYRTAGAVIGERVSFDQGAAIYAESIVIGDDCQFGSGTVIQAETLRIGRGGLFGRDNDIMCRRLEFGEMLFLVNRVLIGQGGAFNAQAALSVGHSCLISSDCLINTSHKVSIGDRSCLSPRVSIFTHSHWQNVLEGYQAIFAPVTIGDDVWVTGNCLVTPGAILENGAQALANSVISGRVQARTIVSGVPAQPVGKVRGDLGAGEKDQIMRRIWPEVAHAVRGAGLDPSEAVYAGAAPDGRCPAPVQAAFGACPAGYEGAYFDLSGYKVTGPQTRVADEVRNVLRKHGIRFEPHTWRYRADLGRFNA